MHGFEDWFGEGGVGGDVGGAVFGLEVRVRVVIRNANLIKQEPKLDTGDRHTLSPAVGTGQDKDTDTTRDLTQPHLRKEIDEAELAFMKFQTQQPIDKDFGVVPSLGYPLL